jgi:hypothetical protein
VLEALKGEHTAGRWHPKEGGPGSPHLIGTAMGWGRGNRPPPPCTEANSERPTTGNSTASSLSGTCRSTLLAISVSNQGFLEEERFAAPTPVNNLTASLDSDGCIH